MKNGMNVLFVLGLTAVVGNVAAAGKEDEAVLVAHTDLKFVEAPGSGGVMVAPLWGDMKSGPHAAITRFPAGMKQPLHTHSNDSTTVVISGTFIYAPARGTAKSYGPGSYLRIPGGVPHSAGCAEGAPCVFFHESVGRFDVKMIDADK